MICQNDYIINKNKMIIAFPALLNDMHTLP